MPEIDTSLGTLLALLAGGALYVVGGLRFRRWAVDDRPGVPRYPQPVETIFLWLVYSAVLSFAIILFLQTLRDFAR